MSKRGSMNQEVRLSKGLLMVAEVDEAEAAPNGLVLPSRGTRGVVRVVATAQEIEWTKAGDLLLIREGAAAQVVSTQPPTAVIGGHEVWAVVGASTLRPAPLHAVIDVTENMGTQHTSEVWLPEVDVDWPSIGTTELDGEEVEVLYSVTDP